MSLPVKVDDLKLMVFAHGGREDAVPLSGMSVEGAKRIKAAEKSYKTWNNKVAPFLAAFFSGESIGFQDVKSDTLCVLSHLKKTFDAEGCEEILPVYIAGIDVFFSFFGLLAIMEFQLIPVTHTRILIRAFSEPDMFFKLTPEFPYN